MPGCSDGPRHPRLDDRAVFAFPAIGEGNQTDDDVPLFMMEPFAQYIINLHILTTETCFARRFNLLRNN
jgi:hypothetical protein